MGDIGNPVDRAQLDDLRGKVDVLLALTGEHATIALDDLDAAIVAIGPKAIIPMHYFSPKGVLRIETVDRFLDRISPDRITRVGGSTMELTQSLLQPEAPRVFVFEQSR